MMQIISQNYIKHKVYEMPEQIIDIRERIEKMRIKFEDDKKSTSNENFVKENNVNKDNFIDKNSDDFIKNEEKLHDKKISKNNVLSENDVRAISDDKFPSVSLSVKNPISSKILVILMLLQVLSNVGIFVLLFNVLE